MKSPFRWILSLVQPINLLLAGLAYLLGLSVARYLGISINSVTAILGGSFTIFALASSNLLNAYFASPFRSSPANESQHEQDAMKRWLLYVSFGLLAVSVILVFYLFRFDSLKVPVGIFIILDFLVALVISIPPFRLADRGFGELGLALLLTAFPIITAFLLQSNNLHRLVSFLTFPLVFLALAYFLVLDFPIYSSDQKCGRQSLLVRLTWQRAIPLHDILVLVSYLLFAAAPLFGIPYVLVWSPLLTLPLAIYQIFVLRNITIGLKPNWTILIITATTLVGLNIYLLMLTFWLR